MLQRRNVIIAIIIGIVLLVIGLIFGGIYLWSLGQNDDVIASPVVQEQVNQATENGTQVVQNIVNEGNTTPAVEQNIVVKDVQSVDSTARALALSFTERLGSYSNQSDFVNYEQLYPAMTASMQEWASGFVAAQRAKGAGATFYGITSRVLNIETEEFNEGATEAKYIIKAQRIETRGTADDVIFEQNAEVRLQKIDNVWKVDFVKWL
jgi:hypothetical protein